MNPIVELVREHTYVEDRICVCGEVPEATTLAEIVDGYDVYLEHIKVLSAPILLEMWKECWHKSANTCRDAWHWEEHAHMPPCPWVEKENT